MGSGAHRFPVSLRADLKLCAEPGREVLSRADGNTPHAGALGILIDKIHDKRNTAEETSAITKVKVNLSETPH